MSSSIPTAAKISCIVLVWEHWYQGGGAAQRPYVGANDLALKQQRCIGTAQSLGLHCETVGTE